MSDAELARRARREARRTPYMFMAPWFIGLFGLTIGPILASLYLAFTDFNLRDPPNWIGLENYQRLFSDDRYLQALKVTTIYTVISVPIATFAALMVAVMLSGKQRGIGLYRASYYLPSLLGGSVAIAVLWRQIFGSDGLVNQFLAWSGLDRLLALIGFEPGSSWVGNPQYALTSLMVLNIWQFGAPMIIFLAGLKQVPQDLIEAAAVDGASRTQRFWRITIPLISPLIFFNLLLGLIGSFRAFTSAFIVTGGGPLDATLFYTLYLYMRGFTNWEMGYASAMAWILVLITAALTAGMFLTAKYWVYYEDQVKLR